MGWDEKELWARNALIQKSRELGRTPKKDDFDDVTKARIKAFLGPWPRALENAGLKSPKIKGQKKKSGKNKKQKKAKKK